MKDCYAVQMIRWFYTLPEKDNRRWYKRLWHKLMRINYLTQEGYLAENPDHMTHLELLAHQIIENRYKWTEEELGYE